MTRSAKNNKTGEMITCTKTEINALKNRKNSPKLWQDESGKYYELIKAINNNGSREWKFFER